MNDYLPPVLDACCGSRMFWFDRADPRALFIDKRRDGSRELVIDPDLLADFTALPFSDNKFALVIFDPPHFTRNGNTGWMAKKYGKLEGDWRKVIRSGFTECFRVLCPLGTLIFKWNENEIPVSRILELTPNKPLFGNKCGKNSQSHWIVFIKEGTP